MVASRSSSDPPPPEVTAGDHPSADRGDLPHPELRCTRCGGEVSVRKPKKERNPFMPRAPLHVVCADCGLEFEVDQPEIPPSGAPPWG